jgi:hypothetical protein
MSHAQEDEELDLVAEAEKLMRIAELAEGPKGYGVTANFLEALEALEALITTARNQTLTEVREQMLELIGEDYTTTTFGYDEQTLKIANQVKAAMRQRVRAYE